jgi:hypothetical protein
VVVEDRTAAVQTVDGSCVPLNAHAARCTLPSDLSISLGGGDDAVVIDPALDLRSYIHGHEGADRITAGATDDFLFGGPGADELHGGAGDDELIGDDDQFAPGPVEPTAFSDVLDGGPGSDRVRYVNNLSGVAADASVSAGMAAITGVVDRLRSVERFSGGPGADVVVGDDSDNAFDGGPGANVLVGGGGRDVLVGHGRFDGGPGDDVFQVADQAQVRCGPGDDAVDPRGRAPNPALTRDCERLYARAATGLRVASIPTVGPTPAGSGRRLRLRFRCTAAKGQTCRTHLTIRDADGRPLGRAHRLVAPRTTARLTVRMTRAVASGSVLRIALRVGARTGRTRLTRWTVPAPGAFPAAPA